MRKIFLTLSLCTLTILSCAAEKEKKMDDYYNGYGELSKTPLAGLVKLPQLSPQAKYDLGKHPFFTRWQDPASGIESYILTERVAPVQFPFYFTNSSISPDGEYLWFYTAFPPNPHRYLGRVSLNPDKPDIKWFPQSFFHTSSPMVSPDSKGVFFFNGPQLIYMDNEGKTKIAGDIPGDYINNRHIYWISSHLSISADGKYFLVDGCIGNDFFVGTIETATGKFNLLHEFPNVHDHALFSPVNPKQFLFPRDWRRNPVTGKYEFMERRLWVMDIDRTYYKPLCPDLWESRNANTAHEWYSKDGIVCFVDYAKGVFEVNPDTKEIFHVWKCPLLCHAHSNGDRTKFCGDLSPYYWHKQPLKILYFDRIKNTQKEIVSAMPQPPMPRSPYHLDPHPHFSPDEQWIIYMTTVNGKVDVAVTPTAQFK